MRQKSAPGLGATLKLYFAGLAVELGHGRVGCVGAGSQRDSRPRHSMEEWKNLGRTVPFSASRRIRSKSPSATAHRASGSLGLGWRRSRRRAERRPRPPPTTTCHHLPTALFQRDERRFYGGGMLTSMRRQRADEEGKLVFVRLVLGQAFDSPPGGLLRCGFARPSCERTLARALLHPPSRFKPIPVYAHGLQNRRRARRAPPRGAAAPTTTTSGPAAGGGPVRVVVLSGRGVKNPRRRRHSRVVCVRNPADCEVKSGALL